MQQERKLTLNQSEWLWALKRGKVKEYYFKNYLASDDMTEREFKFIYGWIVKDILSTNSYLLSLAWEYFNMDFALLISQEYPKEQDFTFKRELSREDISWLMFRSLAFNLRVEDLDRVIDGDWRKYWEELDLKYKEEEDK